MDWSKAKNVIIVIFLAVNVFLLANIIIFKMGQGISKETVSDAVEILKSRGVTLECKIPRKNIDTPELVYTNGILDRKKISAILVGQPENDRDFSDGSKKLMFEGNEKFSYQDANPAENTDLSSRDEVEKRLRKTMTGLGLPSGDFMRDSITVNADGSLTVGFLYKYKDFIIYDNYFKATIGKTGIQAIECRFRGIKNTGPQAKKVVPAYLMLLKNFNESSAGIITDMQIGFTEYTDRETESKRRGYVWRVKLKDGSSRSFTAVDGEEIKM